MSRPTASMVGRVNVTVIGSPVSGASSLLARITNISPSSPCNLSTKLTHPPSNIPSHSLPSTGSPSLPTPPFTPSNISSLPPTTTLVPSNIYSLPPTLVPSNTVFTCSSITVLLDESENPFLSGCGLVEVILRNSSLHHPSMRQLCLGNADAVVMVAAADKAQSFLEVWRTWSWDIAHTGLPVIMVVNKVDLREGQDSGKSGVITGEEGREMANHIDAIAYLECSAKTNEGVKELADVAAKVALAHAENKIIIKKRLDSLNDRKDNKKNMFRKALSLASKIFRKRRTRFEEIKNSFQTDSFSSHSSNWSRSSSINW